MPNNYPEYTETVISGGGLFDELMRSVKAHLSEEYTQQRLRGSDYTKVYLGSMEAAMANTTQYLIGSALLEVQKLKIEAETKLIDLQRDKLNFEIQELLPLQRDQLQLENDKLTLEVRVVELQRDKLDYEIKHIMPLQKLQIEWQNKQIEANIRKIDFEIDKLFPLQERKLQLEIDKFNYEVTELLPLQKAQLKYQNDKLDFELNQLLPLQKAQLQLANDKLSNDILLIAAQIKKIDAEIDLLIYKGYSEFSNISDVLPTGAAINGITRRQRELLEKQKDGFDRDAEQKLAKLMVDTYAVQRTTDEDMPVPSSLSSANTNKAIKEFFKKVNVTIA